MPSTPTNCRFSFRRYRFTERREYPVGGATVFRERLLEVGDVRAEHVLGAFENSEDGSVNLALDAVVLRLEIQKRDQAILAWKNSKNGALTQIRALLERHGVPA
jgi:hypothetical protein